MAKARTTLTIDEDVLRALKVRAAREGKGDSELIEEVLRRALGLEFLDRIWAKEGLSDEEAMEIALEEQRAARREARRASRRAR